MSSADLQPTVEPPPVADAVNQHKAAPCTNCGVAMRGAYCAACGQRDEPLRQPIGRFLKAAFVEFLGVDGRLWRSLGILFLRPGRLTRVYLAGQRVCYIRPLRLYLTASLLFFFLLSVIDPIGQIGFAGEDDSANTAVRVTAYRSTLDARLDANAERLAAQAALVDSLETQFVTDSLAVATDSVGRVGAVAGRSAALEEVRAERDDERRDLAQLRERIDKENQRLIWTDEQIATAPPDSLIRPVDLERAAELLFDEAPGRQVDVNLPDWWPESAAVRQLRAARTGEEVRVAFAAFFRDVMRRLPTVMFLLLPLFALLLKLLYFRRGWYYSEHLVFGLHTHAFAFIIFTAILLLIWVSSAAAWANMTAILLVLLIPLYFYIAQQRVYQQSWLKTAVKVWTLGLMYFFVLGAGIGLALVLATVL